MEKEFKFEITGDNYILIDFDNDQKQKAKYQISVISKATEQEDKVVLSLNQQACEAFARLFAQLAGGSYEHGYHLHLSLTEK